MPQGPPPSRFIDTTVPSIARCYDAMLGGKDNYEVDRALVQDVLDRVPSMYTVTRDNREWLIRVVRYLAAEAGIDQFLDCGSGLPTAENTHQAVQRINREANVIYVDNDPIVLAHGKALLEENDRTHFADADFRQPDELLSHPLVARHLDFTRPLAFLQVGTLHHASDSDGPHEIMRRYIDALPSGSYVAVSHFHTPDGNDELSELARGLESFLLQGDLRTGRFRTRDEITRFFDGLELLEPGLCLLADWWPDGPRMTQLEPAQHLMLGGLGRKP
jgi:SAM-dependent methyltransferase